MNAGSPRKRKSSPDASPAKSVAKELDSLRKTLRLVSKAYLERIEAELLEVREAVGELSKTEEVPSSKIRDLRDMLMLMHKVQIKADKGRRKDLKKLDSLIGDLRQFLDQW